MFFGAGGTRCVEARSRWGWRRGLTGLQQEEGVTKEGLGLSGAGCGAGLHREICQCLCQWSCKWGCVLGVTQEGPVLSPKNHRLCGRGLQWVGMVRGD